MSTKVCIKCHVEQDISCFNKKSSNKDGYDNICKNCQRLYDKNRRESRKEYCKMKNKEYYEKHKEELKSYQKDYYQKHKDHYAEYDRQRNLTEERKQYNKERNKKWSLEHPDYQKNYDSLRKDQRKEYYKQKRESILKKLKDKRDSNPRYKLNNSISGGIRKSLKENKAGSFWESLVPYTLQELKEYLEKQFTPEMNWNNYGIYWEIDHIIPKSLFNFSCTEDKEFQVCWSLLNLRPLEKSLNRQRPRDGSDISESVKQKILGQNI